MENKKEEIIQKEINGDANRPTDQPIDRANIVQSAFSKLENRRQRFAIPYHIFLKDMTKPVIWPLRF